MSASYEHSKPAASSVFAPSAQLAILLPSLVSSPSSFNLYVIYLLINHQM